MPQRNIKDPSLREWILPTFTTTTKCDQAVASILMMSAMQKYFTYSCEVMCGLPSVTLLGRKEDWEKLEGKLERLPTFGEETAEWYTLWGVLSSLSMSLTLKKQRTSGRDSRIIRMAEVVPRICQVSSQPAIGFCELENTDGGTGWITAFCFWNEDGKPFVSRVWQTG